MCGKRCPPEIRQDLPRFENMKSVLHDQQPLKSQHGTVRDNFVKFLKEESKRIQTFLLDVTKPHTKILCSKERRKPEDMTIGGGRGDDMCANGMSMETALHMSYRNFKSSSDQMQKRSEQARSLIFSKGNPPRVLWKIGQALHNYDTTLSCDWQAIATQYVILNFQIHNFKLGTGHMKGSSRVVSISDFASLRMKDVFIKPSQKTLKLVLRLSSEESSEIFDELDYLTILRFRKPPLWKGTFDTW